MGLCSVTNGRSKRMLLEVLFIFFSGTKETDTPLCVSTASWTGRQLVGEIRIMRWLCSMSWKEYARIPRLQFKFPLDADVSLCELQEHCEHCYSRFATEVTAPYVGITATISWQAFVVTVSMCLSARPAPSNRPGRHQVWD